LLNTRAAQKLTFISDAAAVIFGRVAAAALLLAVLGSFLNHNAAAGTDGRGGVRIVGCAHLRVINDRAGVFVPDFDAQFIHAATASDLSIDRSQDEVIAGITVDLPETALLREGFGDNEVIVIEGVELEVCDAQIELCFALWVFGALEIFRDEPKTRFAGHAPVGCQCASR